jgi:hypothetical protein
MAVKQQNGHLGFLLKRRTGKETQKGRVNTEEEGEERGRKSEREPKVSLRVPRFNAFSILMAFADGCIEM